MKNRVHRIMVDASSAPRGSTLVLLRVFGFFIARNILYGTTSKGHNASSVVLKARVDSKG